MIKDLRHLGNEIELKGVQFQGRDGPDKINGGSYSAVAPDTSKIVDIQTLYLIGLIRDQQRP